jgi:hypothetical protein
LQFYILDKGYLPSGDKLIVLTSYLPGPGILSYTGLLLPIVVLKFRTNIFFIVETGYLPYLLIEIVIGYFPGPGIFYFSLFIYYNFPDKLNEFLFSIDGKGYSPGPGFLFFKHATKGPVIFIYYRPFPNPNPFFCEY